ncbi:hormogonium polysaccharide biosynthesis glycosyltransferase HpsP [Baaleninema sp.]|uniref:hormogonium polysaccharide biosynthesis glycosyltransferase HpsP n=1 Tax=Baaleninema sp. TaxID=3101197 RepID=UPI003D061D33
MKPLKILQIVPSISLVYGGPSQMVRGFSQALARQGADVTVITTDSNGDAGQPPLEVPLNQPISQDGYTVRYFRCSPFRRYKFSLDLLRWLWTHAQEYDIAHIHALFSPLSSVSAWVARQRGLPYVLRPLGTLDPADLRKKQQLKKLYAALLERENLAKAAAIHFTSSEEARISERFGVQTTDWVIPLGVTPPENPENADEILQELGIDRTRPLLLFMSRIEPKKGLDLLIPALERLVAAGFDFQFALAGSNPQDPQFEKSIVDRIASSSLKNRSIVTGFVGGEVKAALLHGADLFVLPSYYENFGIAVAEAMAVGTPVAISDRVQIWEAVQGSKSGWVSLCTVDSVFDRLSQALSDLEECQKRGNNARRYASQYYSWDAIAKQAIEAYSGVLRVKGR